MTPRRVTITLEVETDAPLKVLRQAVSFNRVPGLPYSFRVVQAQANVIAAKKDTKIRRR